MNAIKNQIRNALSRDGGDHINISAYAETDIGKISSPDWRRTFFVPHVGDFVTPRAFANWAVSGGNEELRHSTAFYRTSAPLADFRLLILFAKYYQLCSMRSNLVSGNKLLNLPWVMYKKHISGIREFDRWDLYAPEVKEMIKFILTNGAKNHYTWKESNPEAINCFDYYMEQITGEDFIPFEELNRIAKEKSQERSMADKAKTNQVQDEATGEEDFKGFYANQPSAKEKTPNEYTSSNQAAEDSDTTTTAV